MQSILNKADVDSEKVLQDKIN